VVNVKELYLYQPDIHQCRCSLPVNFEEGSMDESKVKEAAIEYLRNECGYGGNCFIPESYGGPLTTSGKARYLDRGRADKISGDERRAVDFLANYDGAKYAERASWYPDLNPQAKLILDECGVQTYEVEAITEELSDYYTGNLEGAQTLHVEKKAVSGGVHFQVTSSDLSGAYLTSDYDTAKQLLESLGYEVVE